MYRYLHLKGFHFQLLSWASVVDDVHSLYKSSGAALVETFSHAASLLKDALTLADYLLVGNSNNLSTQNYYSIRNQVWLPCTCGLSTSIGRGLLGRRKNKQRFEYSTQYESFISIRKSVWWTIWSDPSYDKTAWWEHFRFHWPGRVMQIRSDDCLSMESPDGGLCKILWNEKKEYKNLFSLFSRNVLIRWYRTRQNTPPLLALCSLLYASPNQSLVS